MFISLLFCFVFFLNNSLAEEKCFKANIGVVNPCKDFENKILLTDGLTHEVAYNEETGEQEMLFGGSFTLENIDITEDFQVELQVCKETENGEEIVTTFVFPFCESMKKDDAPHKPIMLEFNITECPVKIGSYGLGDAVLKINLDAIKSILTSAYVAEYKITMVTSVTDKNTTEPPSMASCHVISTAIVEYDCPS